MYRIMLADDEGIVIESLTMLIQKNFGELCEIRSAKTGRSVIELAESFRPDIAVMDIQMPGINGIDAIEEIKKFSNSTYFIVMSAFDKFDYAKRAIDLGVIEYLTKPANAKKIIASLERAMKLVDQERSKRKNDLEIKEKMEIVVPIIESGFIYNILFHEDYSDDAGNFKQLLEIDDDYGCVMVIEFGDELEKGSLTNPVGATVKAEKYYQELREIVKEFFYCVIGPVMANKIAVFIPMSSRTLEYNERVKQINRARDMVRKLKLKIGEQFRVGIGSVQSLSELPVSYKEANYALKRIKGSVAHFEDYVPSDKIEDDYPYETEQKMFAMLKKGNLAEVMTECNQFFDWMVVHYEECPMDIKLKVLETVMYVEREAFHNSEMKYHFRDRKDYLETVLAIDDYEVLRKWFLDKISATCQYFMSQKEEEYNDIISKAKNYIKNNYHKDISLDEVSRVINISPYYFSKVFKEETGENFIEYLTGIRIEKAKELLKNNNMSIKEVCAETGYSDPNYFSRLFKKNVGVTPTEYSKR